MHNLGKSLSTDILRALWIAALLAPLLVWPAVAADPECSATAANPAQLYDAMGGVKLCTPEFDEAGTPLEAGELTRCIILRDGAPFVTLNTTTPGSYFEIAPPATGAKRGTLAAYCEGVGGVGDPTATYQALWRRARPGRPEIK